MTRHSLIAAVQILLAFPLQASAAGVPGVSAPPVLTVNREQIPTTAVQPGKRGNHWYIPVEPVARALQQAFEYDPAAGSVSVSNPITGDVLSYDDISGEIRRNDALELTLPPGLTLGTSKHDLLLPLSILSVLFEVRTHIDPDETEIVLMSFDMEAGVRVSGMGGFSLNELKYRGYSNRRPGRTDGGLTLETGSRLGRGNLHTSISSQAAEGEGVVVRNFLLHYTGREGGSLTAGDVRTGGELRWLGAFGRGGAWSREWESGRRRMAGGWVRLSSGHGGGSGTLSHPRFEGDIVTTSYAFGARPGAPAGQSLGLGTAWVGKRDGEEEGTLIAAEHRLARGRLRAQTMSGLFAGGRKGVTNGFAWESSLEFRPWRRWSIGSRLGSYESRFRLPATIFAEEGSRFYVLGAGFRPWRLLSLQASRSEFKRDRGEGETGTDRITTVSAMLSPGRGPLRTAGATLTSSEIATGADQSDLMIDVRGGLPAGGWFASARTKTDEAAPIHLTTGWNADTRMGTTQLTGSWLDQTLEGVSLYWIRSFLRSRSLQITLGARWSRAQQNRGGGTLGQFRLTWNFGGFHRFDLLMDEHQSGTTSRINGEGMFFLSRGGGALVPATGAGRSLRHISTIEGRVYLDRNLNGLFDDGDRPLNDVAIMLDGGRFREVTGEDGRYRFAVVSAGDHTVSIAPRTVRADLCLLDGGDRPVVCPAFHTVGVDFRTGINRTLQGIAFEDRNLNGKRDEGEPGVGDLHILVQGGGDTVTDWEGRYRLGDLSPGVHVLLVDRSSLSEDLKAPDSQEILIPSDRDPGPILIPLQPVSRPVIRTIFTSRLEER